MRSNQNPLQDRVYGSYVTSFCCALSPERPVRMRSQAFTNRTIQATLALAVAGAALGALAGCTKDNLPVPAATKTLPRLYISDVKYRVRGEVVGPGADASDLDKAIKVLSEWKDLGTFLTPNLAVTIDPEIIIQTTAHRTAPAEELVDEQIFTSSGAVGTQKVFRNPLFFLDYAELKYKVEGYELPTRTFNLNMAMKQTYAVITKLPVSNADQVVRALWDKPDTTPPAVGTVEITIYGRDMDPLLLDKSTQPLVTRSFPVRYTYGSALLGEAVQGKTPLTVPQPAVFGTPTPAPAASASP